ncbi:MESP2 protein, partial [Atractosteus spatula]|nr:MESP2 protein [Atractosteus spatula]
MDFNFSPSFQPCGSARGAHSACPHGLQASKSPLSGEERLFSVQPLRKTRSKDPSRQRKSASEKEKLRMRDLTKALHNLRTYLPPSVAPAGQTLTKIETLRLTIRYISHLSAQLGLSQEALAQRGELDTAGCHTAPAFPGCYQYSSIPAHWVPEPLPGLCQYTSTAAHPVQETGLGSCEFSSMLGSSDREEMLNSSTDSLLQSSHFGDTTQSCQVRFHSLPTINQQG